MTSLKKKMAGGTTQPSNYPIKTCPNVYETLFLGVAEIPELDVNAGHHCTGKATYNEAYTELRILTKFNFSIGPEVLHFSGHAVTCLRTTLQRVSKRLRGIRDSKSHEGKAKPLSTRRVKQIGKAIIVGVTSWHASLLRTYKKLSLCCSNYSILFAHETCEAFLRGTTVRLTGYVAFLKKRGC